MRYTYVIDAGHGGMDMAGKYTTDPKKNKKYTFPDGHTVYEGVINRDIARLVEAHLKARGVLFVRAYDNVQDWPLSKRVKVANDLHTTNKPVIYISIHSNAGKGRGFEIFTSPGQTKSDKVADVFIKTYMKRFPQYPMRSDRTDRDLDKEADYTVLTDTKCPAILIENLFFDNREEAAYLESDSGQSAIAGAIVEAISIIERDGI